MAKEQQIRQIENESIMLPKKFNVGASVGMKRSQSQINVMLLTWSRPNYSLLFGQFIPSILGQFTPQFMWSRKYQFNSKINVVSAQVLLSTNTQVLAPQEGYHKECLASWKFILQRIKDQPKCTVASAASHQLTALLNSAYWVVSGRWGGVAEGGGRAAVERCP